MRIRSQPPLPAELSHLKPTDLIGLGWSSGAVALTGIGFWLATRATLVPWLTGQLVIAAALLQWFVVLHECGHGTLFRTRRLHAAVGHLAGFFSLIPFHCWRHVHGRHHKWTGWQDVDPTTALLAPRQLSRLERALVNVCWRYWIPLFATIYRLNNFWNVPRLLRLFKAPATRRRVVLNVAVMVAVYVTVAIVVGAATLARVVGLALLLAFMVEDVLLISQHTHVPMRSSHGQKVDPYPAVAQEPFTRSLRLPAWASRMLLTFDAHELHHMYPFVPGYRLAQIPYVPGHEVAWWQWVPAARAVPGEVLLFHDRNETGLDV
jgi:fatty acid desaturase